MKKPPIPKFLRGLKRDHYVCGAVDVPWKYRTHADTGLKRSAERHYRTMTLDEIEALPVGDYFAKNAHLFFWTTGPFISIGAHCRIMRAWGFEPVALAFVWLKPTLGAFGSFVILNDETIFKMGMGHTTRQNAEFVILGRRGNPKRNSRAIRQIIVAPAREHSRKPDEFFKKVEAYCDGPRLELFGREPRKGWTVRGDQADKFAPSRPKVARKLKPPPASDVGTSLAALLGRLVNKKTGKK